MRDLLTTRPLKIAMLSVHSCPLGKLGTKDTGGMSVYIRELAWELGKHGHLVDVYTRAHDPDHEPVMELGKNARLIHIKAGEDELHKLAIYIHLPDFACHLESFRKSRQLKYDVIYSHYWLSAWVGKLLQSWWNTPHMVMFHTLGAVKNAIGLGEDEPELRIETERYLIKNCDRIIAATEKEKADIISHYGASPGAVNIVPCGVNLELFRPMDRRAARRRLGLNDGKTIVFAGRIEPLKGVDKLLMAMHQLKDQGLRLLVIGGDGDSQYDQELQKLSRELNIQDTVTFLGLVRQEELPCFYSAADVCVIPSYYESFGLVALEALACGTPVVSTPVGVAVSVLNGDGTGYLVADNAPRRLAEKIVLILSRPAASTGVANSIRSSVAAFGWPNIARAIVKECQSLIPSKK